MNQRSLVLSATFAVASLLALAPAAAPAATSAMPTCAAGDPVVWENAKSKVFHLQGDSYYGKTKSGTYACQSAAVAAGFHLSGSKSKSSTTTAPSAMSSMAPGAMTSPSAMTPPDAMASPSGRHHRHRTATPAPVPSPAAT